MDRSIGFQSHRNLRTMQTSNIWAYVGIIIFAKICSCQLEMNSLLAMHLLSGGNGGGGSGLFGGGLFSGASGSMSGGSGNLLLHGLAGTTSDMSAVDMAVLTNGVKTVVGQHASPDFAMIRYASMQDRPPATWLEMAPYITLMVELAKKVGLQMPDGSIQFPVGSRQQSMTTVRKNNLNLQRLQNIVNRRSMAWFARSRMASTAGMI